MRRRDFGAALCLVGLLAGGGGGGGGSSGTSSSGGSSTGGRAPPPPPPSASAGCSRAQREAWAAAQLIEWYLFPETLPANLDATPYTSLGDYVDALTAPARAQGRDRYFTYVTSIAQENAYYSSGSSAGFGIRLLYDDSARSQFVSEAFEGAPALAAVLDRGTEIGAIVTSAGCLTIVAALFASGGPL